jgi:hypothetical protein
MTVKFNNIVKTTVFPDVFTKDTVIKANITIDPTLHANVVSLSTGQVINKNTANTSGK